MRPRFAVGLLAACGMWLGTPGSAEEVHVSVLLLPAHVTGGEAPADLALPPSPQFFWRGSSVLDPRVVLLDPGEVYFQPAPGEARNDGSAGSIVLLAQLPAPGKARGRLWYAPPGDRSLKSFTFTLPEVANDPLARDRFLAARREHYRRLTDAGLPGTAWFRHHAEMGQASGVPEETRRRGQGELEDTLDLLTGNRALSENLQLDRVLRGGDGDVGELSVDISTLPGLTVAPIDWKPRLAGLQPELDPLAELIPEDQHAVFFPSFQAMIGLLDEADRHGTPLLELLESRSEDALTRERYEKQLGLGLGDLGRLLGPAVIASVAITGSDPYLRLGSDVAVLFETRAGEVLKSYVTARYAAMVKSNPNAKAVEGEVGGLAYQGVIAPDRTVSSYLASQGKHVLVTNSLAQLRRLAQAADGKLPRLAAADEYVFFRHRYPRNAAEESAFVILTDATIRRWCSPAPRIADSRRVRAAAVLAELRARQVAAVGTPGSTAAPGSSVAVDLDFAVSGAGAFALTPSGPTSEVYGTLGFLTPLAEVEITRVTKAEAAAYQRFRDTYQNRWRNFFDPIAIRFKVERERALLDLTVLPLIGGSEYRELIDFTQGGEIRPRDGDPHPEAGLHTVLAINPESRLIQQFAAVAGNFVPGLKVNPLAWLGSSLSIYADADPRWDQLARRQQERQIFGSAGDLTELPIAVHIEVKDALGLAGFLTTLRAFIDGASPGLTRWETLKHGEVPYVKVSSAERLSPDEGAPDPALYYAAGGGSLVLTPSKALLERALDRRTARATEAKSTPPATAPLAAGPWIGKNFALRADRRALDVAAVLFTEDWTRHRREKCWANLPILNEWRRLFPDDDPVKTHERLWGTRLVCPAGGQYVWNEADRTLESTALGHPGAPRGEARLPPALDSLRTAAFGLTFELDGLRARVEIER